MKTVKLSVTDTYVLDWGVWEMLRELAQNCLDAKGEITYTGDSVTFTNPGKLELQNLLYGGGTKANDDTTRGKHGEGFKNALLISLRENLGLTIESGSEVWTPYITHNDDFDCDTLAVDILDTEIDLGFVRVTVTGLNEEDIQLGQSRLISDTGHVRVFGDDEDYAFEPVDDTPMLFVGGIYVGEMPKDWWEKRTYSYSYNLSPATMLLDRDRTAIDADKLQEIITTLLINNDDIDLMVELASANALDVQGYSKYHSKSSGHYRNENLTVHEALSEKALARFYEAYGDNAYPVDSYTFSRNTKYIAYLKSQGLLPISISDRLLAMYDESKIKHQDLARLPDTDQVIFLKALLGNKGYCLKGKARKQITDQLFLLENYV